MRKAQREEFIVGLIEQHGVVTIDDITTHCDCSAVTARRDLRRLEDDGLVRRIYGGALRVTPAPQPHISGNGTGRTALVDRADVLVVVPSETTTMSLLLDRAQRAGVPIVAESVESQGAMTVVAIDDYRAGYQLGTWVAERARKQFGDDLSVLDVTCDLANTAARSRGFAEGLRAVQSVDVRLFTVDGRGLLDESRRVAADALAVQPDINVIFGINDDSALGALEACRTMGLDERELFVVSFGLEGTRTKELLRAEGAYRAGVAMFPELVGRTCIDAAVCAYHGCALPAHLYTPFAIVTTETLSDFYEQDHETGEWVMDTAHVDRLPTGSPHLSLLGTCTDRALPKRIGFVEIFSSHEWYQNIQQSMQRRAEELGITLEVVDASRDAAHELDTLKRAIGYAAADLVDDGDTIILDTGTSTAYLARALRGRQHITVITNSLAVLTELQKESGITLVSSGGVMRSDSQAFVAAGAEATFKELRADKAFITGAGLTLDFGLSSTSMSEATVKQAMIRAARKVLVLLDHTKLDVESLVKVAPIEHIHQIVTDAGLTASDRLAFAQQGIEVVSVDVS